MTIRPYDKLAEHLAQTAPLLPDGASTRHLATICVLGRLTQPPDWLAIRPSPEVWEAWQGTLADSEIDERKAIGAALGMAHAHWDLYTLRHIRGFSMDRMTARIAQLELTPAMRLGRVMILKAFGEADPSQPIIKNVPPNPYV